MKHLFNLENPVIQFLTRVGDLILVNCLFLICCLPIFTIGAATAGLHKVTQDLAMEEEKGVFKTFFRAFAGNFKQATLGWLAMLVILIGMGGNWLLVSVFLTGTLALVCKCVIGILTGIVLAVTCYYFHLLVRYDNTIREHVINSGVLAVVKLPRTIVMMFLNLLPILIAVISLQTFLNTFVFWITIGFGFCSYLCSTLLTPVFKEMEAPGGPNMQVLN